MNLLAELWCYARVRKKYWLLPIILALLVLGGLLMIAHGSALGPFIYTFF